MSAAAQTSQAEAFVEAFGEAWRAPDGAAGLTENFRPLMTEDVRLIQPQMPPTVGIEAFRTVFAETMFTLVPDLRGEVEEWAARGDVVFIVIRLSGTMGGRSVEFRSCDRITLRDGRLAERIAYMDPSPLLGAAVTRPRAWGAVARVQGRNVSRLIGRNR